MPKKLTDYEKLAKSSKERLATMLDKIYKAGFSTTKVKKFTDKEFKEKLSIKQEIGSSGFKGQRSLARQIALDEKRRLGSAEILITRYAKTGLSIKELREKKIVLVKSAGAGFWEMAKKIQQQTGKSMKDSYEHANQLLQIPQEDYDILEEYEVELLIDYDSP